MNAFHLELLHSVGYSEMDWGWDEMPTINLPQGVLSLDEISPQHSLHLLKMDLTKNNSPSVFKTFCWQKRLKNPSRVDVSVR